MSTVNPLTASPHPRIEVPRYSKRDCDHVFYHQMHGHVPGAEQEKILEPEPDGDLRTSPHINMAWRHLSTLAPRLDEGIGLSFANLSTQPEPGLGGVAIILVIRSLRGSGIVDHVGREGALIRQALISVNRGLSQPVLALAASALMRHAIGTSSLNLATTDSRREGPVDAWYLEYCQNPQWTTEQRLQSLLRYLRSFRTLPDCIEPNIPFRYSGNRPPHQLIYIQHEPQLPWPDLIAYASHLTAALHLAAIPDCPWSAVEVGTKLTFPHPGITIRFIPKGTIRGDEPGRLLDFDSLPAIATRDSRQEMQKWMAEQFGVLLEPTIQQSPSRPTAIWSYPRTTAALSDEVSHDATPEMLITTLEQNSAPFPALTAKSANWPDETRLLSSDSASFLPDEFPQSTTALPMARQPGTARKTALLLLGITVLAWLSLGAYFSIETRETLKKLLEYETTVGRSKLKPPSMP